jgi:uncharacterized protein (DUF488 family)
MTQLTTIGYEGFTPEAFMETLGAAGIAVLIDVRQVPSSRRKGFSKKALTIALEVAGIDYVHLVGLGNPKAGRDAARAGRMADYRKIYAAHMATPAFAADLATALDIARGGAACLMCLERDPENCHRKTVAGRMAAAGLEVRHLMVS